MDYRKCVACKKGWKTARDRKAWAAVMKGRYPRPEDWYRVRFSDEVHFGYGPQAKSFELYASQENTIIRVIKNGHWAETVTEPMGTLGKFRSDKLLYDDFLCIESNDTD